MRAALIVLALLALPATASAQAPIPTPTPTVSPSPTPTPEPTAAPHVAVAGVDVGGFTESQLYVAMRTAVRDKLRVPYRIRDHELSTHRARQEFDVDRTVRRVLKAADFETVAPAVTFDRERIRAFVQRVAKALYVAPRSAAVRIHVTHIGHTKARSGRELAVKRVRRLIARAFKDPTRERRLRPKLKVTKPAVGFKQLRRNYPSIITVDKSSFTLRLFKHLRYDRSYSVAVGQPAYPTPEGLFAIQSKQVNPTWTAPNSPWAGESAGQSYSSSDPNNPLKARWMGVSGSVGIHGTGQDYSIGTAASHGCIRMHVSDVIALYDRVSIGTPVLIAA
jgi:lipoprotein-anchoring transpeptidase ErfK/SrfK